MKFWVGVTDKRWFEFLRSKDFDEVNFWQPSAKPPFVSIAPGTPYFFKLKRPYHHIGGFGTFVSFVRLPLYLAWEAFGEKNGASSYSEFVAMILSLRSDRHNLNPEIGCTLLAKPVFFNDRQFVEAPNDWAMNIVTGKTYASETQEGQRLVDLARSFTSEPAVVNPIPIPVMEQDAAYSLPYLARARLGQGTFRALVTDAYGRRCAITGENILPVLEAAHIRPFASQGPHRMSNGMLLRSDFHKLFDLGYITVTPALRVEVSPKIREEWFNGKVYYRLHGQSLAVVPQQPWSVPAREYLQWHNENTFHA